MTDSIRVLQITDFHLLESEVTALKGFYPEQRLDAVLASIRSGQSVVTAYHHLLLTGDLAQDAKHSVYQRILDKTVGLAQRRHWLAGNHDDTQVMSQFSEMQQKVVLDANWAIVLLDSTSNPNGVGSGSLSTAELALLASVDQLDVDHVLVALHHPPVNVGSVWQDEIKLANAEQFWQVLDKLHKVRAVTFGHLHQDHHIIEQRAGKKIELFATPASAPQFKKQQLKPILEDDPLLALPAFREFELFANGQVSSVVHRVSVTAESV